MLKKIRVLVATFIIFTLMITNLSALAAPSTPTFSDVTPSDWYYQYVEQLVQDGVIDKKDQYHPNNPINRAELIKIVIEATGGFKGYKVPSTPTFDDVQASAWYYAYIETALYRNIASGYKDASGNFTGKFGPADPVTRAQATKMLTNAFGVPSTLSPDSPFSDVPKSEWYYNFVTTAYNQSIIDGYKDQFGNFTGKFGPNDLVTRGQVAKLVINAKNYTLRTSPPSSSSSSSSSSGGGAVDTGDYSNSNWVTYTETGSFTADYPDEWTTTKTDTSSSSGTSGAYDLKFTDEKSRKVYNINIVASKKSISETWKSISSSATKVYDVTISGQQAIGYTLNANTNMVNYVLVDGSNQFTLSIYEKILSKGTVKQLRDTFTLNTTTGYNPAELGWLRYTEDESYSTDYPDNWKANLAQNIKADGSGKYELNFKSGGKMLYTVNTVLNPGGGSTTVDALWQDLNKTGNYTKVADLTIGGQKAISYQYKYTMPTADQFTSYIFTNGNFNYELEINTDQVTQAVVDKILQAFTFI